MKKKFVSLFSGAGGLDQGFIDAGWEPALMTDFWKPAVDTLVANHPGVLIPEWDLSTVQDRMILDALKGQRLAPKDIACVTGGPPCQPFSRLNQNQLFKTTDPSKRGDETSSNMNDPRRSLFMDFLRVVRCLKPPFFVMENVADLKTRKLGGSGSDKNRLIKNIILEQFEKAGYRVAVDVLWANEHDVPQLRKRIIFIGARNDLNIDPSMPPKRSVSTTGISVRSEFAKIRPEHPNQERKSHSDSWLKRARLIPPGGYYADLPLEHKVLKPVGVDFVSEYDGQVRHFCLKHVDGTWDQFWTNKGPDKIAEVGDLEGMMTMKGLAAHVKKGCQLFRVMPRMGTYLRRIRWDVSHTVTRNPLIHPQEHREITIREKAAIQTFPPDYEFKGKRQDQHVLVGNAVPCNLGREIAQHIERIAGWQR